MASNIAVVVVVVLSAILICDCECAAATIDRHEVCSGKLTDSLDFSTSVSLLFNYNGEVIKRCGGARVSTNWILTSAECLYGDRIANGTVDIVHALRGQGGKLIFRVRNFEMRNLAQVIHHGYDPKTQKDNIALLRVPLYTVPKVVKLAAPQSKAKYEGKSAMALKWLNATTQGNEYCLFDLVGVPTIIVDNVTCKKQYPGITDSYMCVSCSSGNRLSQSDFGVPLVTTEGDNEPRTLVGIGSPVFSPSFPKTSSELVFLKVSYYTSWIQSAMK